MSTRFWALLIICLLLKIVFFLNFFFFALEINRSQSRCSRPPEMAILRAHPIFHLKKLLLESQTQKIVRERTLKISKKLISEFGDVKSG